MGTRSLEELRNELMRLMLEHIETLKKETFIPLSEEELCLEEDRLKRIREVSADFIAAMKRNRQ
jgi:hypothetical protein